MSARKTKKYDASEMERFLDVRVRDRYVGDGTITNKQVDKHMGGLPDSEDVADYVDLPVLGASEEDEAKAKAKAAEDADKDAK
jgi:hypothetical protein